jgi:RNA polymerase subunit RPABC4/transcription elongation factor Spt4
VEKRKLEEAAERRCPKPQCGRIVPEGKNFCTSCGTRISG